VNDVRIELRRDPRPDPEGVGEDDELVARIRAEIATAGPMTFARFMELALYEPDHGYYRRPAAGPGRDGGDFLTSPEAHPIFGAAVARLIEQAWTALERPSTFLVEEHGAGSGALAEAILDALRSGAGPLGEVVRYRPVEVEPARLTALSERLERAGLADRLATGADAIAAPDLILANEVLDALPVHRVAMRDHLAERFVTTTDDGFAEIDGEPSTPALAAHLADDGVTLVRDGLTEIPLAADAWLADVTRSVSRGLVVLIDYGAEGPDLHGPARPNGSLRTFSRHTVGDDPFVRIGRQDLTTHVCLTGLRRAARDAGLETIAETTQAELLVASGAGDLVAHALDGPDASLERALELRSALARLLDPRKLGGYHVEAFGRGWPDGVALPALARVKPR
jgi:SAM-dependent MidA family methyltransferase